MNERIFNGRLVRHVDGNFGVGQIDAYVATPGGYVLAVVVWPCGVLSHEFLKDLRTLDGRGLWPEAVRREAVVL